MPDPDQLGSLTNPEQAKLLAGDARSAVVRRCSTPS
jgi:hypothetical protein